MEIKRQLFPKLKFSHLPHIFEDIELKLCRLTEDLVRLVVKGLKNLRHTCMRIENKGLNTPKIAIQHAFAQFLRTSAETLKELTPSIVLSKLQGIGNKGLITQKVQIQHEFVQFPRRRAKPLQLSCEL